MLVCESCLSLFCSLLSLLSAALGLPGRLHSPSGSCRSCPALLSIGILPPAGVCDCTASPPPQNQGLFHISARCLPCSPYLLLYGCSSPESSCAWTMAVALPARALLCPVAVGFSGAGTQCLQLCRGVPPDVVHPAASGSDPRLCHACWTITGAEP